MENLLLYFAKINGLIILFYLMYVVFLRKETFFVSNRWYFLTGLLLSLILPLITFTKTIWIETTPLPEIYEESIPLTYSQVEIPVQEIIDWSLILMSVYIVISILIILKIGVELVSFFKRIRKQNKQKESDYTLVDSNSAENPFSFFSYIVINKNMFTEEELQHILTHESVHVKQKHSFDVLIGKVFCALFWVNPIIWLYRKAMLQNLEFIADNETFQQIENKYLYQKTLLKVVTHQHNLSITNQFYQSLIKKRIVMLHTNQSHKKNVWKYATILPLLVGFMLLFQIETIAQVKERIENSEKNSKEIEVEINKNTTDQEIEEFTNTFKQNLNIEVTFDNLKRNKKNEIVVIKVTANVDKTYKPVIEINDNKGIETFTIKGISDNNEKDLKFSTKASDATEASTSIKIEKNTTSNKSTITNYGNWKVEKYEEDEKPILFVVNGKKQNVGSNITINKGIKVISSTELDAKEASKKYGNEAKNGALEFVVRQKVKSDRDDDYDFPTPPSPPSAPSHPYENLREAPSPPDFPSVPDFPSNIDDKKAMEKYEKAMASFEKKMKAIEPKMKEFEKKMEAFEKEMKLKEPDMKNFEKEMKIFEEKMKVFEKEMEVYEKEIEKNIEK